MVSNITQAYFIRLIMLDSTRTASEVKVQHAQGDNAPPQMTTPTATDNPTYLIPGGVNININSTAEEAADRALNSVLRKLDKSLSVESTVNELVAEATDQMNLATIYYGKSLRVSLLFSALSVMAHTPFLGWGPWL